MATQYSKATGFHTTGISRSKDIEEVARKLGADMVANNGGMLKQSDGGGADIVPVTNNSYKVATEALRGLGPNGRMILMGISAEPLVVTSRIIGNCCRIIGSMQNGQEYLYEALDYVAKGKVKVIAETYSLDDIAQAYQKVASGNVRFRAVIRN